MSNPLFNLFGGDKLPGPMGNLADMLQQFKQFKESISGRPEAEVMKLLQSGKISRRIGPNTDDGKSIPANALIPFIPSGRGFENI